MQWKSFFLWVCVICTGLGIHVLYAEETKPPDSAAEAKKTPDLASETKNANLPFFDKISLSGIGNLHITQKSEANFTIEADKIILPLIQTYVKDKTLYINIKDNKENLEGKKAEYFLTIKNLKSIESYSSGTIFIPEEFTGDQLVMFISNFGEAQINVNVEHFTANIEGGGKITARGRATKQNIAIKGAGEFLGNKLNGKEAELNIQGSGMMKVQIADQVNVKIAGEGTVKYCGTPKVTKEISDKGSVSPLDKKECG